MPSTGQNHLRRVSRFHLLAVPRRDDCCARARSRSRASGVSGKATLAAAAPDAAVDGVEGEVEGRADTDSLAYRSERERGRGVPGALAGRCDRRDRR